VEGTLRCLGVPFVAEHLDWIVPVIGLISVMLAVPVAWLSYYLCERPFSSRKPRIPHRLEDLKPVPIQIKTNLHR
jgi:peptidoglycan/LPS O-acetylase OafA/YrhL